MDADYQTAWCLFEIIRPTEAIGLLEPLAKRCERLRGPNHESTEYARQLLGEALILTGKPEEGARHIEAVLAERNAHPLRG